MPKKRPEDTFCPLSDSTCDVDCVFFNNSFKKRCEVQDAVNMFRQYMELSMKKMLVSTMNIMEMK